MQEILQHVIGVILGALAIKFLGLNKKTVMIKNEPKIGWFWKLLRYCGKTAFWYGLFVFIINLLVSGAEAYNTRIGLSIFTLGMLSWIIGSMVIAIKRS